MTQRVRFGGSFVLFLMLCMVFTSEGVSQTLVYEYDIFDEAYYSDKQKNRLTDFKYHRTIFPPKPLDKWEFSFGLGVVNIFAGQVRTKLTPLAVSLSARKSLTYILSVRGQYNFGIARNSNYYPTYDYIFDGAYNSSYDNTNASQGVYRNARTVIHNINTDLVVNLSTFNFHSYRRKQNVYLFFGPGLILYKTNIDALDANGEAYNFDQITNANDIIPANRSSISSQLNDLFDGNHETEADYGFDQTRIGNIPIDITLSMGIGYQRKLSDNFNIYIEDRLTYTPAKSLDGSYYAGPGSFLVNTITVGVNYNYDFNKKKRTRPLWWLNPFNYIYKQLNEPRSIKIPEPILLDTDQDGVSDQLDKEPETSPGVPVNTKGISLDTDGDGVLDYRDLELITPSFCRPVDENGIGTCPQISPSNITINQELIEQLKNSIPCPCDNISQASNIDTCTQYLTSSINEKIDLNQKHIYFEYNSAQLAPSSRKYLSQISNLIKQQQLSIIVYGKIYPYEQHSQYLSDLRVDSVTDFLIQKGVNKALIKKTSIDPSVSVTNIPVIKLYCPSGDSDNDGLVDIDDPSPFGEIQKNSPEFSIRNSTQPGTTEPLKEISQDLTFPNMEDKPDLTYRDNVRKLVKWLKDNPNEKILISNPTYDDGKSSTKTLESISKKRNTFLQEILIEEGIPKNRINTVNISSQQPKYSIPLLRITADNLDTDNDGVLDIEDECPTIPGEKQYNGCPTSKEEFSQIKNIGKEILFDFDSDRISRLSYPKLDSILLFLRNNPNIQITIVGNTDNVGTEEYNTQLSKRRAYSIERYLINKGIKSERLNSIGMGYTNPVQTNESEEGRKVNRRVEFWISRQ